MTITVAQITPLVALIVGLGITLATAWHVDTASIECLIKTKRAEAVSAICPVRV